MLSAQIDTAAEVNILEDKTYILLHQILKIVMLVDWDFSQAIVLDHKDTTMEAATTSITAAVRILSRADPCQVIQMNKRKTWTLEITDLSAVGKIATYDFFVLYNLTTW